MDRPEYDRESDRLLRHFASVFNPAGPEGGHNTQVARDASAAITKHAANWKSEWYKPFEPHDPA